MAKTLHIDGPKATIAIFNEGTSLNLLDSPENYYDKINFHTGLPYVKQVSSIVVTVNFSGVLHETETWDDSSKGCGGFC
jgi:hypothetical protein